MPKESEWAKDAQEERNGTREPTSNEMGQVKTQSGIGIKPMIILSHKQQAQRGPTSTGQIVPRQEQRSGMTENDSKITKRAKNGLKKGKPTIKQGTVLERSKL